MLREVEGQRENISVCALVICWEAYDLRTRLSLHGVSGRRARALLKINWASAQNPVAAGDFLLS